MPVLDKMFFHKLPALLILAALLVTACDARPSMPDNDFTTVVDGLQIKTYGDITNLESPILLVFLHGDGCVADYMKTMANTVVRENSLLIVMARPGCVVNNRRSRGSHGNSDYYTPERIDAVSKSVHSLKTHYRARKVFLIGHSGGAATAGIIAGKYPDLVDGFVAVAFPANIPKWRAQGADRRAWGNSLSPHEVANDIKQSSLIYFFSGSDDENTPSSLSDDYVDVTTARGLDVKSITLEGENHSSSFYAHKVWSTISSLTYK